MRSVGDRPAFSVPGHGEAGEHFSMSPREGMTYRQWLVGMALQGLMADPNVIQTYGLIAVKAADEAIAILDKASEK